MKDHLRASLDVWPKIVRVVGTPDAIGLALLEAYLGDDPWMTVVEVSARTTVGQDTVRRRLQDLVTISRVRTRAEGRLKFYCLEDRIAQRLVDILQELGSKLQNAI